MSNAEDKKNESRVVTPPFRLSFPALFTAKKSMTEGGKPKFGCMAIWTPAEFTDKEKALWAKMMELCNAASMAKFKKPMKDLAPNFKRPFRRGDEKPEYGMTDKNVFSNITSWYPPQIVMADAKTKVADEALRLGKSKEELLYPGCWMRASVNAYAYTNIGSGIALGLNNMMFLRDGERLDNRVEAEVEFDGWAEAVDALPPSGDIDDFLA
jgi:hypothetical protein